MVWPSNYGANPRGGHESCSFSARNNRIVAGRFSPLSSEVPGPFRLSRRTTVAKKSVQASRENRGIAQHEAECSVRPLVQFASSGRSSASPTETDQTRDRFLNKPDRRPVL